MKKFVALLVAALMTATLAVSAFAAEKDLWDSPTVAKITVDSKNAKVSVCTDKEAAKAIDAMLKDGEKVLGIFELTVNAGEKEVKLSNLPISACSRVLHWNGKAWDETVKGTFDGKVLTLTGDSWSPIAVIGPDAANNGGNKAPNTNDMTTVYVACAAVMACAAAAFVVKSKKAA